MMVYNGGKWKNWIGVAIVSGLLVGCSSEPAKLVTHAVEGRVVNGKSPISHATVVLHPVQEFQGESIRPRGQTDADGKFRLTTYTQNDGAPSGEYRVTIQKWTTEKPEEGPQNRLSNKLSKPETSGLTATIQEGENKLDDFKISK
ncbi:MAG TPA: hypothetical protein DCF63_08445 [Planctomycetaceae bacterium]|nr:hypothetical protein [Planctomycetaceae bacterium]